MNRFTTMEAFVHVFETGSFSGAARRLRVGQPAVSKMIAQLEDRLGVRLVVRSTHGLTSTEAGQRFYERAKRSLDEADEADLAARGAAATLAGRLTNLGSRHVRTAPRGASAADFSGGASRARSRGGAR